MRCAVSSEQNAKAVFGAFDIDNSGFIGEDEFLVGFCVFTNSSPASTARFMFHCMDGDLDGNIDKDELERYMTDMVAMLRVLFPKMMEFQTLQGSEETRAALQHSHKLLTQKGEIWLQRKEQRIKAECHEIFKVLRLKFNPHPPRSPPSLQVCEKDAKGRVTEKAWLAAFARVAPAPPMHT